MAIRFNGIRYDRLGGVFTGYSYHSHFKIGTIALNTAAVFFVYRSEYFREKILSLNITRGQAVTLALSISLLAQCIFFEINRWYEEYGRMPCATWFQRHVSTTLIITYLFSCVTHLGILLLSNKITSFDTKKILQRDVMALSAFALLIKVISRLILPTQLVGREYLLPYYGVSEDHYRWRSHLEIPGVPGLNLFG